MRNIFVLHLILHLIVFTVPALSHGGQVRDEDDVIWDYSDAWGPVRTRALDFKRTPIPSGTTVYALRFDTEVPGSQIFHANMTGVIFLRCHLRNVVIPAGNTLIKCSTQSFRAQNDLEDWILNDDGTPKEPVLKEVFIELELSTQPADIPAQRLNEPLTLRTRRERGL